MALRLCFSTTVQSDQRRTFREFPVAIDGQKRGRVGLQTDIRVRTAAHTALRVKLDRHFLDSRGPIDQAARKRVFQKGCPAVYFCPLATGVPNLGIVRLPGRVL